MKRGIGTTILAIMALEALLFAGLCLAAADDVPGAIRLPTDGAKAAGPTGEGRQQVGEGQKRPWDCCDDPSCVGGGWPSPSSPPICNCFDRVTSCSSACQRCMELYTYDPPRMYRCLDPYVGSPGPKCKQDDGQTANAGSN